MSDWLEAERRVERAQQFFESQRWEEALAELDIALSINPNNAAWHAQRGSVLDELERTSEAAESYQQSLDLESGDRDVALALAITLNRLGRFARAIEVLEKLAQAHPTFEPAYCHRIHAYARIGLHDRAEEMFYLAQQIDEQCPHCFFFLGESLSERGQRAKAIFCWKRTLDIEPAYLGVNERIARAYRVDGDLKRAREWLLREIRNDPGNTDLLFEFGQLLVEAGEIGGGAAKFAQIIELDPEHLEAHYALGSIWLGLRQPERALTCFNEVLRLEKTPDLPDFHLRRGESLLRLERWDDARKELERGTAESPNNVHGVMLLGDCHLRTGQVARAADAFRKALAIEEMNCFAHHKLAIALIRLGQCQSALTHALRSLELKPDHVPSVSTAALAHIRMGRWGDARRLLRQSRKDFPKDETIAGLLSGLWRARLTYYARGVRRFVARTFGFHR